MGFCIRFYIHCNPTTWFKQKLKILYYVRATYECLRIEHGYFKQRLIYLLNQLWLHPGFS